MKPINYSNTILYKLVCKDLNITDFYIGHTTNFRQRKNEHKSKCNKITHREYNCLKYQFIRANGGWDNWDMVEIEKFACNDGNEARARERYWYELLTPKLNVQTPNRSRKEYRDEHQEEMKHYQLINKETFALKSKQRYQQNKDEINIKRKETKYTCECCNITIRRDEKPRHEKTLKHSTALEMYVKH